VADSNALPPPVVFDPDDLRAYGKRHPTLDEIISLLDMKQNLPTVQSAPLGGSYGNFRPSKNEINLNRRMDVQDLPPTLTHEMTHALDKQMRSDYYDVNKKYLQLLGETPEVTQFREGHEKLVPRDTKFEKDPNNQYRYSNSELRAFGVERGAFPKNKDLNPVAPHLDFTMATEAAILRDLYLRMLQSKNDKTK